MIDSARVLNAGTEFIACDNPAANRLTLHILAAVAENEAKAISDRTKAALAVASEMQDGPPGWQSYTVQDPEGHEWYFTQFTDEND